MKKINEKMFEFLLMLLSIIVIIGSFVMAAHGAEVTFTWGKVTQNADGTPLADLKGYRIYCSQMETVDLEITTDANGNTVSLIPDLNSPSWVADIPDNTECYVTAYDSTGNESDPSNKATLRVPPSGVIGFNGTITNCNNCVIVVQP